MLYNQNKSNNDIIMPLLMNFTIPTSIEEGEEPKTIYDPISQISYSTLPYVGTYSLQSTSKKTGSDRKNGIDDSKWKNKIK